MAESLDREGVAESPTSADDGDRRRVTKRLIVFVLVLVGSVSGLVGIPIASWENVQRVETMSARATAEVVRVDEVRFDGGYQRAPVYRWEHEGQTNEYVSFSYENDQGVGDRVPIRFNPDLPRTVSADEFMSLYGDIVAGWVFAIVVLLPLAVFSAWSVRSDLRGLLAKGA